MWNAGYWVGLGFFCLLVCIWLWFLHIERTINRDEVLYFLQLHDSKVVMIVLLASGEDVSVIGHGSEWRHLLKAEECSAELCTTLYELWQQELDGI